ncbi:hypothetical protein IIU_05968 [Bacillus cereus VD133]|uniref:Uncharacterized protein n=1 Tax=Bacillus cereus VD133 TaxID=1053233 RepID=A0A9W5PL48_BACCE|nr:hypothetical protein IIU_05968 [Bacillus cereus VD133]
MVTKHKEELNGMSIMIDRGMMMKWVPFSAISYMKNKIIFQSSIFRDTFYFNFLLKS